MTMKLAKTSAQLIVALAAGVLFVPALWAQQAPAPKPAKRTHAGKIAKSAHTAPASAPAPAPVADAAAAPGAPAGDAVAAAGKRDPFMPLINEKKENGGMEHLPPGKAGLVIASVRVDGTVKAPSGMIAVLSNPEQKVYFVREGDRLYDGDVEKIGLDGVTFKENSKDAFGKAVEHMVTKRIYPSAGEQQ
jgi:hypothetical protein